jgi:hypothetical protein
MIIFGYNITLSDATVGLAMVTAMAACFTAMAAWYTKKLSEYNRELIDKNDQLIQQNENHHKDRLRPICIPIAGNRKPIASFDMVIGIHSDIFKGVNTAQTMPSESYFISLFFANRGLGPSKNVRFHLNNMREQRITKDFFVTHILVPGEELYFSSEIPAVNFDSVPDRKFSMDPAQIVNDAYFIVCEYESVFSGEQFHTRVAKGYRDPFLANDGKNNWRYNRSLTPPIEIYQGLDKAIPVWPIPSDNADYPGESLNNPQSEKT